MMIEKGIKTVSIKDDYIIITTTETKLLILLKEKLSKNKTKKIIDLSTTYFNTSKVSILDYLEQVAIPYKYVVTIDEPDLYIINTQHLVGRFEDKLIGLKSIRVSDNFLNIEYEGGIYTYYINMLDSNTNYVDIYRSNIQRTIYDVTKKVVDDTKHTLLLFKLLQELEVQLNIKLVPIHTEEDV